MSLVARLMSLVALAVTPALAVVAFNEFNLRRSQDRETRQFVAENSERAAAEVRQEVENVQRVSAILRSCRR